MSAIQHFNSQVCLMNNGTNVDASYGIHTCVGAVRVLLFELMAKTVRIIIVNEVLRARRI